MRMRENEKNGLYNNISRRQVISSFQNKTNVTASDRTNVSLDLETYFVQNHCYLYLPSAVSKMKITESRFTCQKILFRDSLILLNLQSVMGSARMRNVEMTYDVQVNTLQNFIWQVHIKEIYVRGRDNIKIIQNRKLLGDLIEMARD